MSAIPREPGQCEFCGAALSGGLDTFGEPGHECCQACFISDPWAEMTARHGPTGLRMSIGANGELVTHLIVDGEVDEMPEIEIDEDGMMEVDGNLYCGGCGHLAQPGDEEFDWCDHRGTSDCSYYCTSSFRDDDEDVEDYWGEDA